MVEINDVLESVSQEAVAEAIRWIMTFGLWKVDCNSTNINRKLSLSRFLGLECCGHTTCVDKTWLC
jgi:hypothetical protein